MSRVEGMTDFGSCQLSHGIWQNAGEDL